MKMWFPYTLAGYSMFFGKRKSTGLLKEIEENIFILQNPSGDSPSSAEHAGALQFLLKHADLAHPRLLQLIKTYKAMNPPAIIGALSYFGQPESIPVLYDVMAEENGNLVWDAADALAHHPHNSAFNALIKGLSLPGNQAIIAAADGLMTRGDSAALPVLLNQASHEDATVRYHIIQAMIALGYADEEKLKSIAENDPDDEIRNLIRKSLNREKME